MVCSVCIHLKFFTEIIVDSHAVIRNNTKRFLVYFAQFLRVVTFYKTVGPAYAQDVDRDTIHCSHPHLPTFTGSHLCGGLSSIQLYRSSTISLYLGGVSSFAQPLANAHLPSVF